LVKFVRAAAAVYVYLLVGPNWLIAEKSVMVC